MKQNAKPAKEKVKEPILKEQEQVEIRFQEESQEHTFEESFTQDELTLFADPYTTSGSELSYKPPDEEVLTQGTLIDGKYEIVSLLGHGGMGSVYLARHKELKTQVAVKVLHRFLVNTPSALERFKKEARAAHTLSSKNLVSVLDYGVLSYGQPYLTMHFIDGMNLAEYLKKNGPLSIADTLAIARQVAAALEEAHSKNIVHRDIKPSNILIEGNTIKDGSIRVVDFGISKGMTGGENTQQVTHTGQVFGSPFYMSPEQCKGENVDFRTDLYSLGCVIFECLTGSLPFQGRNAVETLMMHCNETPPTIGVHGKPPRGFKEAKEVLKKLLEKDRNKRFEDAAALNQTLQGIEAEKCEHKFFAKSSAKPKERGSTAGVLNLTLVLLFFGSLFYLSSSTQNASLVPNRKERLEELFKLGNAQTMLSSVTPSSEDSMYLRKAILFAQEQFGTYSLEAADAYSRLGHHYTMYQSMQPPDSDKAYENYLQALKVVDYIDQHQPELRLTKQFRSTRQKSLMDIATVSKNFEERKELVDRALKIGPLPDGFFYWNQCQDTLFKQNRYYDAGIAFIEMQTGENLHLSEKTIQQLKSQKTIDFVGSHNLISDLQSYWVKAKVDISEMGNVLECIFSGSGGYENQYGKRQSLVKRTLSMNGVVENGMIKATSTNGDHSSYLILRIGKYIVLLDKERPTFDADGKYIPMPLTDCLFVVE